MADFKMNNVGITAISAAVPKNKVFTPAGNERFIKAVGIRERRMATDEMCGSDLGYHAAKELNLDGVRMVIYASQTHDHDVPFTSNLLQHRLGLPKDTATLDINAGCAGFVSGLLTAFLYADQLDKVLFIIGDTIGKTTGPHDKASELLFGDGAAAVIVERNKYFDCSWFNLFSDGGLSNVIRITGTGHRDTEWHRPQMHMDGIAVHEFTMREVITNINKLMKVARMKDTDLDAFVFHQSNGSILKTFQKMLKLPDHKVPINIDRFGNTSGVSIPLAIVTEDVLGRVLCSGYGSGLTWGNCIIDIEDIYTPPLVEV